MSSHNFQTTMVSNNLAVLFSEFVNDAVFHVNL